MGAACLGVLGGREASPVESHLGGRYRAIATKSSMTKLHARSLPVGATTVGGSASSTIPENSFAKEPSGDKTVLSLSVLDGWSHIDPCKELSEHLTRLPP